MLDCFVTTCYSIWFQNVSNTVLLLKSCVPNPHNDAPNTSSEGARIYHQGFFFLSMITSCTCTWLTEAVCRFKRDQWFARVIQMIQMNRFYDRTLALTTLSTAVCQMCLLNGFSQSWGSTKMVIWMCIYDEQLYLWCQVYPKIKIRGDMQRFVICCSWIARWCLILKP